MCNRNCVYVVLFRDDRRLYGVGTSTFFVSSKALHKHFRLFDCHFAAMVNELRRVQFSNDRFCWPLTHSASHLHLHSRLSVSV